MKNAFIRFLSAVLALTLLMMPAALAEEPVESPVEAPAEEAAAANPDDVMVLVNGVAITRAAYEDYQVNLVNYLLQLGYDMTSADTLAVVSSIALDTIIQDTLLDQKAIDLELDLTEEERAQVEADNAAEWAEVVEYYVANYFGITAESTEEEAAEARLNTLALLESMGYTESVLLESALANMKFEKIHAYMVQGAEVTEADIQAAFNERVEADRQLYENDIVEYEWNEWYGQQYYDTEPSCYTPSGYRGVIQILLEVDQALLDEWQSLNARFEEQQEEVDEADVDLPAEAEEAVEGEEAAETADPEPTEAPVTQEQVDAAYAAIIASVQPTIDEIMQKFESGTPFADLVAEYGIDPGMTEEPYKSEGYPVHLDSIIWDPAFVVASFSVDEIGAVSEPVVGSYGVYIVQYIRDVPAGAVKMTDEIHAALADEVLATRESELYQATMDGWIAEADIVYSDEAQAIMQMFSDDE